MKSGCRFTRRRSAVFACTADRLDWRVLQSGTRKVGRRRCGTDVALQDTLWQPPPCNPQHCLGASGHGYSPVAACTGHTAGVGGAWRPDIDRFLGSGGFLKSGCRFGRIAPFQPSPCRLRYVVAISHARYLSLAATSGGMTSEGGGSLLRWLYLRQFRRGSLSSCRAITSGTNTVPIVSCRDSGCRGIVSSQMAGRSMTSCP